MKELYFESVVMIERLHRLFLEVVKIDLDRQRIQDINNVQALILYNIGENELTVGELTNRGYYLGSNVSYNLRKMVHSGYVLQTPSVHDRRSSHIKLSSKGVDLYKRVDALFSSHAEHARENVMREADMGKFVYNLKQFEVFWASFVK